MTPKPRKHRTAASSFSTTRSRLLWAFLSNTRVRKVVETIEGDDGNKTSTRVYHYLSMSVVSKPKESKAHFWSQSKKEDDRGFRSVKCDPWSAASAEDWINAGLTELVSKAIWGPNYENTKPLEKFLYCLEQGRTTRTLATRKPTTLDLKEAGLGFKNSGFTLQPWEEVRRLLSLDRMTDSTDPTADIWTDEVRDAYAAAFPRRLIEDLNGYLNRNGRPALDGNSIRIYHCDEPGKERIIKGLLYAHRERYVWENSSKVNASRSAKLTSMADTLAAAL